MNADDHSSRGPRASAAVMLVMLLASLLAQTGSASQTPTVQQDRPPVLAYYYIWFNPDSWDRAKVDIPLLGRYSSDDEEAMRLHVQWAKASGIDGFIVSWKHTDALSRRLAQLVEISRQEDFKLSIIYEGLDFYRHPLPVQRISDDLTYFTETYQHDPVFDLFGKPVVIWSGTWKFDRTEIGGVTDLHRSNLQILASQKQPDAYQRIADLVDGNAYYWSSVNPATFPDYAGKLDRMSQVVHEHGGLWFAPAAPGFDARHLGGEREVLRQEGATLEMQYATAMGSNPDAIGLISWNEFSETSHIEPSCLFGDRYLAVTAGLLGGRATPVERPCDEDALATAQAGAVVASPVIQPSPAAALPVQSSFDWDSSAPQGTADRGARIGTIALLGMFTGLIGFSIIKITRRALHEEHNHHRHSHAIIAGNKTTHRGGRRS